jgi:hypothetical protein
MENRMNKIENLNEAETPALNKTDVMRCGLSAVEFTEREMLLERQRNSTRWFSQDEFDRLKELSNKMFDNAGPPHIA